MNINPMINMNSPGSVNQYLDSLACRQAAIDNFNRNSNHSGICKSCKMNKSLNDFVKDGRYQAGHSNICLMCNSAKATRQCRHCHEIRPIDTFIKVPGCSAGYGAMCLQCKNEKNRAKYRAKHINKIEAAERLKEERKGTGTYVIVFEEGYIYIGSGNLDNRLRFHLSGKSDPCKKAARMGLSNTPINHEILFKGSKQDSEMFEYSLLADYLADRSFNKLLNVRLVACLSRHI